MISWIFIISSIAMSYYFIDLGSSDYTLSKICPILFSVSIIIAYVKISSSQSSALSGGSSSSGWSDGSSGGDCGGGDGG